MFSEEDVRQLEDNLLRDYGGLPTTRVDDPRGPYLMAGPDVLVLHHAASFDDVWHVYESLKATQLTAPGARAEKGKDVRSDIILLANGAVSEKHQRHLEENGIHFLPDWRRHPVYREKLRHSLLNGGRM